MSLGKKFTCQNCKKWLDGDFWLQKCDDCALGVKQEPLCQKCNQVVDPITGRLSITFWNIEIACARCWQEYSRFCVVCYDQYLSGNGNTDNDNKCGKHRHSNEYKCRICKSLFWSDYYPDQRFCAMCRDLSSRLLEDKPRRDEIYQDYLLEVTYETDENEPYTKTFALAKLFKNSQIDDDGSILSVEYEPNLLLLYYRNEPIVSARAIRKHRLIDLDDQS